MLAANRHRIRIRKSDEECFLRVLDRLSMLTEKHRREARCWVEMKKVLLSTGNWKNAPRGKPDGRNFAKHDDSIECPHSID